MPSVRSDELARQTLASINCHGFGAETGADYPRNPGLMGGLQEDYADPWQCFYSSSSFAIEDRGFTGSMGSQGKEIALAFYR